jgi:hypothetical protein
MVTDHDMHMQLEVLSLFNENEQLRVALREIMARYPDHEDMFDIARNVLIESNALIESGKPQEPVP